jgi:rubrerythrin
MAAGTRQSERATSRGGAGAAARPREGSGSRTAHTHRKRRHPEPQARPRRGLTEADFAVPPSLATPKVVFLNCHCCGHEVATVPPGGRCPKCGSHSWDRFALSARLARRLRR